MNFWFILLPFLASVLTFFSGFGLGTLLTPVFLYFFPLEAAVAMTALVHLANNLFKISLLWKSVSKKVFIGFAPWAIPGALLGAFLFGKLLELPHWVFSSSWQVRPLSFVIGILMVSFTIWEFTPKAKGFSWKSKALAIGGLLSGFFGGLSGHQGALRSMFLRKAALSPAGFVATGTSVAVLVDISRIPIYLSRWSSQMYDATAVVLATLSAMSGALIGRYLLKKITWSVLQWLVGTFIFLTGVGLVSGILD